MQSHGFEVARFFDFLCFTYSVYALLICSICTQMKMATRAHCLKQTAIT